MALEPTSKRFCHRIENSFYLCLISSNSKRSSISRVFPCPIICIRKVGIDISQADEYGRAVVRQLHLLIKRGNAVNLKILGGIIRRYSSNLSLISRGIGGKFNANRNCPGALALFPYSRKSRSLSKKCTKSSESQSSTTPSERGYNERKQEKKTADLLIDPIEFHSNERTPRNNIHCKYYSLPIIERDAQVPNDSKKELNMDKNHKKLSEPSTRIPNFEKQPIRTQSTTQVSISPRNKLHPTKPLQEKKSKVIERPLPKAPPPAKPVISKQTISEKVPAGDAPKLSPRHKASSTTNIASLPPKNSSANSATTNEGSATKLSPRNKSSSAAHIISSPRGKPTVSAVSTEKTAPSPRAMR